MPWTEIVGWTATCIALAGVLLNNWRIRWCFAVWLASNSLSCLLHVHAGMWALSFRDLAFLALAVHGWMAWKRT